MAKISRKKKIIHLLYFWPFQHFSLQCFPLNGFSPHSSFFISHSVSFDSFLSFPPLIGGGRKKYVKKKNRPRTRKSIKPKKKLSLPNTIDPNQSGISLKSVSHLSNIPDTPNNNSPNYSSFLYSNVSLDHNPVNPLPNTDIYSQTRIDLPKPAIIPSDFDFDSFIRFNRNYISLDLISFEQLLDFYLSSVCVLDNNLTLHEPIQEFIHHFQLNPQNVTLLFEYYQSCRINHLNLLLQTVQLKYLLNIQLNDLLSISSIEKIFGILFLKQYLNNNSLDLPFDLQRLYDFNMFNSLSTFAVQTIESIKDIYFLFFSDHVCLRLKQIIESFFDVQTEFFCTFCNFCCQDRKHFRRHWRLHHVNSLFFLFHHTCLFCPKDLISEVIDKSALLEHYSHKHKLLFQSLPNLTSFLKEFIQLDVLTLLKHGIFLLLLKLNSGFFEFLNHDFFSRIYEALVNLGLLGNQLMYVRPQFFLDISVQQTCPYSKIFCFFDNKTNSKFILHKHLILDHFTLWQCITLCGSQFYRLLQNDNYIDAHDHFLTTHFDKDIYSVGFKLFYPFYEQIKFHFICGICQKRLYGFDETLLIDLQIYTTIFSQSNIIQTLFNTVFQDNFRYLFSNNQIGICKKCHNKIRVLRQSNDPSMIHSVLSDQAYIDYSSLDVQTEKTCEKCVSLIRLFGETDDVQAYNAESYLHLIGKLTLRKKDPLLTNKNFDFFLRINDPKDVPNKFYFEIFNFFDGKQIFTTKHYTQVFKNLMLSNFTYGLKVYDYLSKHWFAPKDLQLLSKDNILFHFNNYLDYLAQQIFPNSDEVFSFLYAIKDSVSNTDLQDFRIIFCAYNYAEAQKAITRINLGFNPSYYIDTKETTNNPISYEHLIFPRISAYTNTDLKVFDDISYKQFSTQQVENFFGMAAKNEMFVFYKYYENIKFQYLNYNTYLYNFVSKCPNIEDLTKKIYYNINNVVSKIPSSIPGSFQFQKREFHRLLSITKKLNKLPDLFITLTHSDADWTLYQAELGNLEFTKDSKKWAHYKHLYSPNVRFFIKKLKLFLDIFILGVVKDNQRHSKIITRGFFGKVIEYYIRNEFQARGSLHTHILLWIQDPNIPYLTSIIDGMASKFPHYSPNRMLVVSHQRHYHTIKCLSTISDEVQFCLEGYPRKLTNKTFINSQTNQVHACRFDIEDQYINNYSLSILKCWKSSMDIQITNLYFLLSYLCKDLLNQGNIEYILGKISNDFQLNTSIDVMKHRLDPLLKGGNATYVCNDIVYSALLNFLNTKRTPITEAFLYLIGGKLVYTTSHIVYIPINLIDEQKAVLKNVKDLKKMYKNKNERASYRTADAYLFGPYPKYLFRNDKYSSMHLLEYLDKTKVIPYAVKEPTKGKKKKKDVVFDKLGYKVVELTEERKHPLIFIYDKMHYNKNDNDFPLFCLINFWAHKAEDWNRISDRYDEIRDFHNRLYLKDNKYKTLVDEYSGHSFYQNIVDSFIGRISKITSKYQDILKELFIYENLNLNTDQTDLIQQPKHSKELENMQIRISDLLRKRHKYERDFYYQHDLGDTGIDFEEYNKLLKINTDMYQEALNKRKTDLDLLSNLNQAIKSDTAIYGSKVSQSLAFLYMKKLAFFQNQSIEFKAHFSGSIFEIMKKSDLMTDLLINKDDLTCLQPKTTLSEDDIQLTNDEFQKLNIHQKKLYLLCLSSIILQKISGWSEHGIVINGTGGSGKSFLFSKLSHVMKRLSIDYVILAFTNEAVDPYIAQNINASTFHSFLGLKPADEMLDRKQTISTAQILSQIDRFLLNKKINNQSIDKDTFSEFLHTSKFEMFRFDFNLGTSVNQRLENTDVYIVDEMSMIGVEALQLLDVCLRYHTSNWVTPFGGKLVILTGDMNQLNPVGFEPINKYYQINQKGMFRDNLDAYRYFAFCLQLSFSERQKDDTLYSLFCKYLRNGDFFNDDIYNYDVRQTLLNRINSRVLSKDNPNIIQFYDKYLEDFTYINQRFEPTKKYNQDIVNRTFQKKKNFSFRTLRNSVEFTSFFNPELKLQLDNLIRQNRDLEKSIWDLCEQRFRLTKDFMIFKNCRVRLNTNYNKNKHLLNGVEGTISKWVEENNEVKEVSINTCENKTHKLIPTEMTLRLKASDLKFNFFEKLGEPLDYVNLYIKYWPFTLAYAITVHKAEGKTIPFLYISTSEREIFDNSYYVAFSRGTKFDNIVISDKFDISLLRRNLSDLDYLIYHEIENIDINVIYPNFSDSSFNVQQFFDDVVNSGYNAYSLLFHFLYPDNKIPLDTPNKYIDACKNFFKDFEKQQTIDDLITKTPVASAVKDLPKENTAIKEYHKKRYIEEKNVTIEQLAYKDQFFIDLNDEYVNDQYLNLVNEEKRRSRQMITNDNDEDSALVDFLPRKVVKIAVNEMKIIVKKWPIGLPNLGNFCFLNSALQFLRYLHVESTNNNALTLFVEKLRNNVFDEKDYLLSKMFLIIQDDIEIYPPGLPLDHFRVKNNHYYLDTHQLNIEDPKIVPQQESYDCLVKILNYFNTNSVNVNLQIVGLMTCGHLYSSTHTWNHIKLPLPQSSDILTLFSIFESYESERYESDFECQMTECKKRGGHIRDLIQLTNEQKYLIIAFHRITIFQEYVNIGDSGTTLVTNYRKNTQVIALPIICVWRGKTIQLHSTIDHLGKDFASGHNVYNNFDIYRDDEQFLLFNDSFVEKKRYMDYGSGTLVIDNDQFFASQYVLIACYRIID